MATKDLPLPLVSAPRPKTQHFAVLTGIEAAIRGTLISTTPLVVYQALGSAEATSAAYFIAGIASLIWGLMVPWFTKALPRRWMYSAGCLLYPTAMALMLTGHPALTVLGIIAMAMGTVTTFVCLNAYVLDYVAREDLGHNQSMQMLYAAAPWAIGPMTGVWLHEVWRPAPFLIAGAFALVLLATFWHLRLGNGRQIARARGPAPNPLAYMGRFLQQPRLIAGWLFAVIRSCGWWVYVVYLPIYCIESGLGDKVAGTALSVTNALLFISPLMLRLSRRGTVRRAVRLGFGCCALGFLGATLLSPLPPLAVAAMMAGSIFLVYLDVIGSLPFLMAVKPSERAEMSAIFSSFRDVSGIVTPGVAWLVLLVVPLPGIFAATGLGLGLAFAVAGRLHPRLGALRPSRGGAVAEAG
ncbi:MFS transporter [Fuscibacter oryzae]|uniref:MFS transporter n=1 Tax=Fuscibacter oryzae TaxID=2803939 RepID=A0A8J7MQQ1_9RHOB|nr:MFS transporter [Fuscibacter oryzae]MBL4927085.1 MFS transporter [Fuscibacter oryzae]